MENNTKLYYAFKEMEEIVLKNDIAIGEKKIELLDLQIQNAINELEKLNK